MKLFPLSRNLGLFVLSPATIIRHQIQQARIATARWNSAAAKITVMVSEIGTYVQVCCSLGTKMCELLALKMTIHPQNFSFPRTIISNHFFALETAFVVSQVLDYLCTYQVSLKSVEQILILFSCSTGFYLSSLQGNCQILKIMNDNVFMTIKSYNACRYAIYI